MVEYEPIFWDIETTGLNPMAQSWWTGKKEARVLSVAIGNPIGWKEASTYEDADYDMKVLWGGDEYELLIRVNETMGNIVEAIEDVDENKKPFLVGWNSRNFDHPYIGARFARKRLDGQYFNHKLKRLDMMRALGNDDITPKTYPAQDDYAKKLGIEVNDGITGKEMPEAYERGDWDTIIEHSRDDVREMMKVFVQRKDVCMEEFYDHYDLDGQAPLHGHEATY